MLTSHEKCNHHVRDLVVGKWCAVFVGARHEVPDHVILVLFHAGVSTGFDDFHVCLRHFLLRVITFSVVRQGCPGEHEVNGRETHVEVVVEIGEAGVEFAADFFTLEGAGRGIDCKFCHFDGNVQGAFGAFETGGPLEEIDDFVGDQGYV